jgi:hypothetical protein
MLVLHNERVPIRPGTASFDLAGIDDRTAARPGVPVRAPTWTRRWTGVTTAPRSSCWRTSR